MDAQRLVEELVGVGLARDEAAAYIHVLGAGPAKASDVAPVLAGSRANAYRLLERMVHGGLVEASLTRPLRYTAVRPERLFEELRASAEERLRHVEELGPRLMGELTRVAGNSAVARPAGRRFRIIHGRRAGHAARARRIRRASREVVLIDCADAKDAADRHAAVADALVRRLSDGVKVRVIVPPAAAKAHLGEIVERDGAEVREAPMERPIGSLVIDRSEALVRFVEEGASQGVREGVNIWTDAPAFIENQVTLFDAMWASALPASRR